MAYLPRKFNVEWKSPLYEIERFHRDLNRFFESALPVKEAGDSGLPAGCWSPAVDIIDQKDKVAVRVDLPGLTKDDIDVGIENNVLTIRGEKKQEVDHENGDVLRAERYCGFFFRAFTLPVSVNSQKINAKFENGVLKLSIFKKEEAKQKQIEIDVK